MKSNVAGIPGGWRGKDGVLVPEVLPGQTRAGSGVRALHPVPHSRDSVHRDDRHVHVDCQHHLARGHAPS